MKKLVIKFLLFLACVSSVTFSASSPELRVHLFPHSHQDLGWIKTITEYYEGTNLAVSDRGCVRCIINTVIEELQKDPRRKFSYCEMGYFSIWWREQTAENRSIALELIRRGQLELVGAGFVSNDEATSHYEDVIFQYTHGHRFIKDEMGIPYKPSIGWQLDTFGHTLGNTYLSWNLGLTSMFLSRIDQFEKNIRKQQKTMEIRWTPDIPSGLKYAVDTHIFFDLYVAPGGICFDDTIEYCHDAYVANDDQARGPADRLLGVAGQIQGFYATNDVYIPIGNDFGFKNATKNFESLERVNKVVNGNKNGSTNSRFSTPTEYVLSLIHI
eukprot:TRINITY_DN14651_c0_g2_i2.p1 TRINITY_DN14651_c0_g2~~TRINITY_DN14651_c0_g2_i2.p1  ORF type:complete len:327 (+),score=66.65 TRINITY_DN14651_c0_g2_i2:155-1135(+)